MKLVFFQKSQTIENQYLSYVWPLGTSRWVQNTATGRGIILPARGSTILGNKLILLRAVRSLPGIVARLCEVLPFHLEWQGTFLVSFLLHIFEATDTLLTNSQVLVASLLLLLLLAWASVGWAIF